VEWAEHVARLWDRKGAYRVLMERSEEREYLQELNVDGKIILKWVFKN